MLEKFMDNSTFMFEKLISSTHCRHWGTDLMSDIPLTFSEMKVSKNQDSIIDLLNLSGSKKI